jgi:hypothetical protein
MVILKITITKTPRTLALPDISLNCIPSNILDTTKKLARTPKTLVLSKVREVSSQHTRRNPLEKLQSPTNNHRRRALNKQMHMIRQELKLVNKKNVF